MLVFVLQEKFCPPFALDSDHKKFASMQISIWQIDDGANDIVFILVSNEEIKNCHEHIVSSHKSLCITTT